MMRDGFEDGPGLDDECEAVWNEGFSSPDTADEGDGLALLSCSEFHFAFAVCPCLGSRIHLLR